MRFAKQTWDDIHAGQLAAAVAALRDCGVTHVVQAGGQPLVGPELREVYADDYYRVYQLTKNKG